MEKNEEKGETKKQEEKQKENEKEKKIEKVQLFTRKTVALGVDSDLSALVKANLSLVGRVQKTLVGVEKPKGCWAIYCRPHHLILTSKDFLDGHEVTEADLGDFEQTIDLKNSIVKSIKENFVSFISEKETFEISFENGSSWKQIERKILKWAIQTNFNEKFVMRKEIGSGGYASVYLVSKRLEVNAKHFKKDLHDKEEQEKEGSGGQEANKETLCPAKIQNEEKDRIKLIGLVDPIWNNKNSGRKGSMALGERSFLKGSERLMRSENLSGFRDNGPEIKVKQPNEDKPEEKKAEEKKQTVKTYAVKVIKKVKLSTEQRKRYMVQEIEIMREVSHPNVIRLHEVFETKNHLFLVLDYHQGGDLYHQCRLEAFREDEAVNLIKQIARAVKYLNGKNIIHRDLKTANILVSGDRKTVIVSDFGLAMRCGSIKEKKDRSGTVGYMAPEILSKNWEFGPPTMKCDVFSIGVIAYEM